MPRSTNTTSQRDRAAMTEKILDAAEHLLRRDVDGTGIPPLTLGDVAKEVGLARSSLYRYYAGVEDLIEAVSMRGFDEWAVTAGAEVRAARESSGPRAGIRAFVESNLRRAPGRRPPVASSAAAFSPSPISPMRWTPTSACSPPPPTR